MTRTLRPVTTRLGIRIWETTTDHGLYRILQGKEGWRLTHCAPYARRFHRVEDLDVDTFLRLHWLTLAGA